MIHGILVTRYHYIILKGVSHGLQQLFSTDVYVSDLHILRDCSPCTDMARGGNGGENSYGYGMYDMGGSYADGGNSYMYYDPRYDQPMYSMARGGRGGYSRTDSKSEMVEELKGMMQETTDQTVKTAIQEAITKLNK